MAICELELQDLEDLIGRDLEGRYLLEEFIDRGSYGAVYRATDRKFNQPVAIKVGLSSREFMKEARLAAEVRHNHIVQVTDFGSDNGLAYLVMEYLDGEDLEKLFVKQGCRLTPPQLRKLVDEIGDALVYAHADHLIHRDLKPRNIIYRNYVSKSGTSGKSSFVLLDFGIAAKLDSEGTQRNRTQDGAGTAEYMAPELLCKNPKATPLSDVYAFGIILYKMMTGEVPFPQSDTSHMALIDCLSAIVNTPPRRFDEVDSNRGYPQALEQLVLQCLEKNPANRPQSMEELRNRFLEIHDQYFECEPFIPTRNNPIESKQTTGTSPKLGNDGSRVPTASPKLRSQKGERWSWSAMTIPLFILLSLGAVVVAMSGAWPTGPSTYAVLSYEQGHVYGKQIDDETVLNVTAGEPIRVTFLIEGPLGDIVHFDQPDCPDGMNIETTNGPVPHTSKCFTIAVLDPNLAGTELSPIQLIARSASRKQPFVKTVRLAIKDRSRSSPSATRSALDPSN